MPVDFQTILIGCASGAYVVLFFSLGLMRLSRVQNLGEFLRQRHTTESPSTSLSIHAPILTCLSSYILHLLLPSSRITWLLVEWAPPKSHTRGRQIDCPAMTIGYLLDNFWVAPPLEERVITRESTPDAKTIKPMHERYKRVRAKHHVSLRVYLVRCSNMFQHYYALQQGYEPPPQTPASPFPATSRHRREYENGHWV